jgi:hypothetical protein
MGGSSSKCSFADSDSVPCRNKVVSQGYSCCYAHKCKDCIRLVVDKGYYYCPEHTCKKVNCKEYVRLVADYCNEHKNKKWILYYKNMKATTCLINNSFLFKIRNLYSIGTQIPFLILINSIFTV